MLQQDSEGTRRLRHSCDFCIQAKTRCNKDKPACHRCVRRGELCVYSVARRAGRPRKGSQARDGGQGVNNENQELKKRRLPKRKLFSPPYQCQQYSSNFSKSDEVDPNFFFTDAAFAARNDEITASPRLDFGLGTGSTHETGLLCSDPLSSMDRSFDYHLDMFQDKTEEPLAGCYALMSNSRTRQDSLGSMDSTPANTQPSSKGSAPFGTNVGRERYPEHSTEGTYGASSFGFSQIETSFFEGSTSPALDDTIRFIISNGSSDMEIAPGSHFHNSGLCFCSLATNKLLVLVSHPALYRQSSRLPLDVVFLFESFINKIHESLLKCLACRTKSSHFRAFLCISTDWVIETLKCVVQCISSRREARDVGFGVFDSVAVGSIVRIGQLDLSSHLEQVGTRSLIKHRLNRLTLTMDKISRQENKKGEPALRKIVQTMMQEIHYKIESVLGMIEL